MKAALGVKLGAKESSIQGEATVDNADYPVCEEGIDLQFDVRAYAEGSVLLGMEGGVKLGHCSVTEGCEWDLTPYVKFKFGSAGAEAGLKGGSTAEAKLIVQDCGK